jgi:hypothetical protein
VKGKEKYLKCACMTKRRHKLVVVAEKLPVILADAWHIFNVCINSFIDINIHIYFILAKFVCYTIIP